MAGPSRGTSRYVSIAYYLIIDMVFSVANKMSFWTPGTPPPFAGMVYGGTPTCSPVLASTATRKTLPPRPRIVSR